MADHQPLQELREASRRVLVSIKAVPGRLREALTASPNKVRNRILAAGCCAAAALLVGAGAWAAAAPGALPVPGEPPAAATRAADDGAAEPVAVALEVSAEGYTEQSSPLVAVVEPVGDARGEGSADDGSASPTEAFAHAVSAEEVSSGTASVELAPGTYTVSFVSPVNQDGSIYRVPEPQEVTVAAPDAGAEPEAPRVDVELDPVPADQVTKEDLDKIKSDLADAVAKGDGTLSGDAGSEATSKAEENASKAPASKPAEEGQKPEEKPAEEKPSDGGQTSGSSGSGSSGGGQSSGGGSSSGGQSSSSGGSSGGGQSSGGSGSSGGGSTAPAKKWVPEKGHYEPVYENVWVPNVSYVRHERWECSSCGNMFSSGDAMDAHVWGTYGDAQHPNGASAIDQSYTETVDNGHYEKKQTGQKWVVDVPGHWE